MVHMTGMIAFVHAYYVLGLRHADGWIGYGGRIHGARFRALAAPGEPLVLACTPKHVRRAERQILARYDFAFTQPGAGGGARASCTGDQTALGCASTRRRSPDGDVTAYRPQLLG